MTVILYTPKFVRLYKKLPLKIQQAAEQKEIIFRKDPFTPSLKTHKLTGELEGLFVLFLNFGIQTLFLSVQLEIMMYISNFYDSIKNKRN
jgi:hypothetical protein